MMEVITSPDTEDSICLKTAFDDLMDSTFVLVEIIRGAKIKHYYAYVCNII